MNNLGLLTWMCAASMLGGGVCASAQTLSVMSLEEIFEIADNQSIQFRPAKMAEDEAERGIDIARSLRLPEINATLSVGYNGDGFTTKRDFSDYQKAPIPHLGNAFTVDISQPIYTGGAITNSIALAKLKSNSAKRSTEIQRDNLRMQLTGFYLDIYKYFNLKKVIEGNIENANNILNNMRARYHQGLALQNDITRYELLFSNLELDLIRINNLLDILNKNLVVTAGIDSQVKIVPDSTMLSRALPKDNEEWWQREADANSPTVKLAQLGIDICKKGEKLVAAERLPKVGLKAGWTTDGPILVEVPPINRNLSYWYVGIGVSYNLSSLYKTNKKLQQSRAALHTAQAQYDATKENIELAIRADYIKYLESYEELKSREKSCELAELNYYTTSTRYAEGMALITDMLDAANAKLDAEKELTNARINVIYYYYKLLFTSGRI
ncbi:MAG: TolC family protein [Muribaculaceae bacterium]|nr:TolC family protein [Muribaculaceae bacterium]